MKRYTAANVDEFVERLRRSYQSGYYAMYSTLLDGIVTEPAMMVVPIDDHMVHRGDGVFESMKCVNGTIYNLGGHLERLQRSATALHHALPWSLADIEARVVACARAGGHADCAISLFVSRGPGSFGVSPYDCPEPQLYIVVRELRRPFMALHPAGARLKTSTVPAKVPFFAGVKNCNYLTNVLMQKEAVDEAVDFVVGFDPFGNLTEGPTENVGIVTTDGRLQFPTLDGILKGTTMVRVMELAQTCVEEGLLSAVEQTDIPRSALEAAAEILIVGTTRDVTAVCVFDGKPTGQGPEGPIYQRLAALLAADIRTNTALLTPVGL